MAKSKIQILDSQGTILKEFDQQLSDQAYEFAEQMEAMDIEIYIKAPSLPRTLAESLGANEEDLTSLDDELDQEIEDHLPTSNCKSCL